MNFDVILTAYFERKIKKLSKKYKSIGLDLVPILEDLAKNPIQGVNLGHDCYKIRMAIKSKGQGKSGGARLITFVKIIGIVG
jgi:mRNA-degrading endonuclease RelE of RelBE toxin-antitoxin system